MKKKILSIIALSLVMAMMAVSLTGCGTEAKATDQDVAEDSDTIIVTDDEETVINTEEEVTETEVVEEETTEGETAFTGAENDEIVLYAEKGEQKYIGLSEDVYVENVQTVSAKEEIPIYDGTGFQAGYIKSGSTVVVTENAENIAWFRFKNPITGTEDEYLYVNTDYIVEAQRIANALSAEEMKQIICESIDDTFAKATILSSKVSGMEVYEFVISNAPSETSYKLDELLFRGSDAYMYKTFYVECTEDEDGEPYIYCKVYMKDLNDDTSE